MGFFCQQELCAEVITVISPKKEESALPVVGIGGVLVECTSHRVTLVEYAANCPYTYSTPIFNSILRILDT